MDRREWLRRGLGAAAAVLAAGAGRALEAQAGEQQVMEIWKTPTCGCCGAWVDHVRAAGFRVRVHDLDSLDAIKRTLAVPQALWSCHTAQIGRYAIEGHVPAAEIRRMLRERPAIAGIAVGGMPVGSPGMEVPGRGVDPYEVTAFTREGRRSVYARYPQRRS